MEHVCAEDPLLPLPVNAFMMPLKSELSGLELPLVAPDVPPLKVLVGLPLLPGVPPPVVGVVLLAGGESEAVPPHIAGFA